MELELHTVYLSEQTPLFSCLKERNIFQEMSISIKQLWLEIIEKNGAQSQYVLNIWYI